MIKRLALCVCATGILGACVSVGAMTPLESAAYNGNAAAVDSLLSQGVDPGEIGPNGSDASEMSLLTHPDLSRSILRKCLEVYAAGRNCPEALVDAALLGDRDSAAVFISKGADLDAAIADMRRRSANLNSLQGMMGQGGFSGSIAAAASPLISRYDEGLLILTSLQSQQAAKAQAPKPDQPVDDAQPAPKPWWMKP